MAHYKRKHSDAWAETDAYLDTLERLMDSPDMQIVFMAAKQVVSRYTWQSAGIGIMRKARRRLCKFTVDPDTGAMVSVDPLVLARGGFKRGRASSWELRQAEAIAERRRRDSEQAAERGIEEIIQECETE